MEKSKRKPVLLLHLGAVLSRLQETVKIGGKRLTYKRIRETVGPIGDQTIARVKRGIRPYLSSIIVYSVFTCSTSKTPLRNSLSC